MKKDGRKIFITLSAVLVMLTGVFVWFAVDRHRPHPDLRNFDINPAGVDKLMIVCHPDDESIFGGAHLMEEDGWLVVCVTAGMSYRRANEFIRAMEFADCQYIMLGYTTKNKKWKESQTAISDDLRRIIAMREWAQIVTHNPEGDYGHINHKITSALVTGLAPPEKLCYFGKYYIKGDPALAGIEKISPSALEKKETLLSCHRSQKRVINKHRHIFAIESWIPADEWK